MKRSTKQQQPVERPQVQVRVYLNGVLVEETVAEGPLSIWKKGEGR